MTISMSAGDVAIYLREHPDFFQAHPDVLLSMTVPHAPGGRAVSLVERQVEVLRERNKSLEQRLADVLRNGKDNEATATILQAWTRDLLCVRELQQLPVAVAEGLSKAFSVPHSALRLWRVAELHRGLPCAVQVESEVITLTASLQQPYCGPNADFKAATWLPGGGSETRSIALLPLRVPAASDPFGLLVLGSPEPTRFETGMGTAFLERIAETAGAALARLLR